MAGAAGKRFGDFALPPGQLGMRHVRIGDLIDHIVDFAAEGVERGDGGAPLPGQKQESVIKAAPGCGGFLLDILLGRHAGDCCMVNSTQCGVGIGFHVHEQAGAKGQ